MKKRAGKGRAAGGPVSGEGPAPAASPGSAPPEGEQLAASEPLGVIEIHDPSIGVTLRVRVPQLVRVRPRG